MRIERLPFIMRNLIRLTVVANEEEWNHGFDSLRNLTFQEGIFQVGPMFFSMEDRPNEPKYKKFEFYLPVNFPLKTEGSNNIDFVEELIVSDSLMMRQVDQEPGFSEAKKVLDEAAEKNNLKLSNKSYVVCTELYQEIIMDMYVPIEGGIKND